MRCWLLPGLLLLAGCATGGGEIEVGVGHNTGGRSLLFDEQPGGERLEYEDEGSESLWLAYTIPLGPRQIEVVPAPATYYPLPRELVPDPPVEEDPGIDWREVGVGLALGAASLFGAQKARTKWVEHKKEKEEA